MVNIQDFLQVFQGSGIGTMEDNLTRADSLSYITNGSRGDLELRGKRLLPQTLDTYSTASLKFVKDVPVHQIDSQKYRRLMTTTFQHNTAACM